MQLTRLRLQGFKSFVDPTELVIAKGLTGVVGPNGCGKSNLLEALRWVMGENRAKAMRGDGMDDVIFAGTDTRPPRNSAAVEIVIDNAARNAPVAFNESDQIEVSRRITREIGSAYNVNGKTVRARDVQMLFADASTGAHSPALVRQGQIGELISAKPKARRRILEEAAGISGLYQRRHEAELKLNAAETNLDRVQDVLESLETQLKSLERQAAQARRYREIAEQLRRAEALLLFLRWREAVEGHGRAQAALDQATREVAAAEAQAAECRRAREASDAGLPQLREEEAIAAAVLQRLTIERDRLQEAESRARDEIETLAARARQIVIDLEREETLSQDAEASVTALRSEEAALREAEAGHGEALEAAQEAARLAGVELSEQETVLDRLTEEAARLAARAAAAERRLQEAEALVSRLDADIASAAEAEAAALGEIVAGEAALAEARQAATEAQDSASAAETALAEAEVARAETQEREAALRARASEAEGELSALSAERQGLERLLARDEGANAQLISRVSVDPGYEAALGAALGDDLRVGELGGSDNGSGWRLVDGTEASPNWPKGAEPLAPHVTAPPALARRLARIAVIDRAAGDAAQAGLAPGERLVSVEGDLWRWDGFRLRAEDSPSPTALRLEQQNRLKGLRTAEAAARTTLEEAAGAHRASRAELASATETEMARREARRAADAALADASRTLSRAEATLELAKGRLETHRLGLAGRREEREAAVQRLEESRTALSEIDDPAAARAAVESQRGTVDLARTAMLAARGKADELRREALAREKRLAEIARECESWAARQTSAATRIAELQARREETESASARAADTPAELAAKREKLAGEIEAAEARRRAASDALASAEAEARKVENIAREAEARASSQREARARTEAHLESAALKLEDAATRISDELELSPEALAESLDDTDTEGVAIAAVETDVTRLRRQRDALGAVNLRAEEDAAEVRTEYDRLAGEKTDLEAAIGKLRGGIAELNREGRERLLTAFDQVNEKFAQLFRHLFGGGEARLVMVESDDPLDAGLEILCQPPGKKLSTLSLLSGGEQTLTALSLIFAVFLSNPAPICVLDEVDAPLDDSNVTRFCDLLDEMRRRTETRFLIITHHAITMSRMDRLFGVTMVERGVSQLVSVDLAEAEDLVDA